MPTQNTEQKHWNEKPVMIRSAVNDTIPPNSEKFSSYTIAPLSFPGADSFSETVSPNAFPRDSLHRWREEKGIGRLSWLTKIFMSEDIFCL